MEGKLPEVRLASTPLKVESPYEPAGDQPQAIEALADGVRRGLRYQNLLGVTGSGKTFTMAKVIEAVQKPTLVMAPNKTLGPIYLTASVIVSNCWPLPTFTSA